MLLECERRRLEPCHFKKRIQMYTARAVQKYNGRILAKRPRIRSEGLRRTQQRAGSQRFIADAHSAFLLCAAEFRGQLARSFSLHPPVPPAVADLRPACPYPACITRPQFRGLFLRRNPSGLLASDPGVVCVYYFARIARLDAV